MNTDSLFFEVDTRHGLNKIIDDANLTKAALQAEQFDHALIFLDALSRMAANLRGKIMAQRQNQQDAALARVVNQPFQAKANSHAC